MRRFFGVCAALLAALAIFAPVAAHATTDPGGGGGGCTAYMSDMRKVGTTVQGTFTIGCSKNQYRIWVQGAIQRGSGAQNHSAVKICNDAKTCSVTATLSGDPAGNQTYWFVFEPDTVQIKSGAGVSGADVTCFDLACGAANRSKLF